MSSLYIAYIYCYQKLVGMNLEAFFLYEQLGKSNSPNKQIILII